MISLKTGYIQKAECDFNFFTRRNIANTLGKQIWPLLFGQCGPATFFHGFFENFSGIGTFFYFAFDYAFANSNRHVVHRCIFWQGKGVHAIHPFIGAIFKPLVISDIYQ